MSVTIGGTYSGLNVSSIIQAIIAADSIPITNLQTKDTTLQNNSSDLGSLGQSLGNLSQQLQKLGSNTFLAGQIATPSNAAVGSASVDATAKPGTVNVNITQLATTTVLRGGTGTDGKLTAAPASTDLIGNVLDETAVDGQTFSVNGKVITLAATDTLDDVIGKINSSGGGVTASYNGTSGAISLTSASPILLGSGADTSDFLQKASLFNNGTSTVSSSVGLGRIDPSTDLTTAGLRTPLTSGTFKINGVSINYSAGDSLTALMSEINASKAGVSAIYDSYSDQMVLSSTKAGPQSITVEDGTSNVATALRLTTSDSQLQAGIPTLFTVNGSTTVRQSESNVIDSSALGVPGVTFTATGTGATQITIGPDVSTIAAAINAFVTQYNSTQSVISQYTSVNTADTTKNGSLAGDMNLTFLAPQLRKITSGSISDTATIRMLSDLGITTNANDNSISSVDTAKLQDALTNHLDQVQALFNDPDKGLTNTVQNVVSIYNDSLNGVIVNEQNQIKQQVRYNTDQITRMQERIAAETSRLQAEFAALDAIYSKQSGVSSIFNGSSSSTSSSSTSAGTASS